MRLALSILVFSSILFVLGCQEKNEEEENLCQCVQTEAWIESRSLSPECVQLCIEVFGTDLKGIHEWFASHCDYEFEPLPTEPDNPPQKI